jgi:NAD(P)-dependent dehydrogenase (short-subunit alcohol dehydrogenase family)
MHFYTIQSKKRESKLAPYTSETYGSEVTGKDGIKMAGKLEGKIALVTGGGTGIGLATAQRFAKEGAYVYITGRRQAELDKAVKNIGGSAKAVRADVSNLSDLDKLFTLIKQEKGRLDVVFANAGVVVPGQLGEITEETYDKTFDINVKGVLFTVQKALPLIPDGGSILINASVVSSKGFPALSVYSATKAALRSFARTWTTDLKSRKIRVNVVSPGPIETPGLDGLAKNEEERKAVVTQLTSGVPLGRMGEPDEIAKAAVFLASADSSFVAGVELFVDGGAAAV